ncbi:ORF49 [Ranid herpesvirus 1]|uniref:ORF49 n=1 Tax=Ranid herpesvirus 1 TaxID=85655 RepID=Q14VQ9_9VIRU|nr:ORF49 [Ranid herpesvirus 1]ABG25728.1 ORF49 [Ranid herpesvirus 1]
MSESTHHCGKQHCVCAEACAWNAGSRQQLSSGGCTTALHDKCSVHYHHLHAQTRPTAPASGPHSLRAVRSPHQQSSSVGNKNRTSGVGVRSGTFGGTRRHRTSGRAGKLFGVDRTHHYSFLIGHMGTELAGGLGFRVASTHVNTVYNRRQRVTVANPELYRVKDLQNSTIRSPLNKFVADKRKCFTVDGVRTTRIEFNTAIVRSSNYTINAPALHHTVYHTFFDLLCRSQGETVKHTAPLVINNINYTSALYGVTNSFVVMSHLGRGTSHYNRPFLFPSHINWRGADVRHQIFGSLYVNSQKIKPLDANRIGELMGQISDLVEFDPLLNEICVNIFLERRAFLNTPNKALILIVHEMWHAYAGAEDPAAHKRFVRSIYNAHCNDLSGHTAQITNQYAHKNVTFVHLIPYFLYQILYTGVRASVPLLQSYAERAVLAGKGTLRELQLMLETCAAALPALTFQDGCLGVEQELVLHDVRKRCDDNYTLARDVETVLREKIRDYCDGVFRTLPRAHPEEGTQTPCFRK